MFKNTYKKKQREDLRILNHQHLLHLFTTNELGGFTKGVFFELDYIHTGVVIKLYTRWLMVVSN